MKLYINKFLIISLLSLVGCSPNSLADLKKESNKVIIELTRELKEVGSREDLLKKRVVLKKLFDKTAYLMIEANMLGDEPLSDDDEGGGPADELQNEMIRVYEIDGGRELIENYQKNAVRTLAEKGINN